MKQDVSSWQGVSGRHAGGVIAVQFRPWEQNESPLQRYLSPEAALMQRVVRKGKLQDVSEVKENLSYWLSKTPEERLGAVEYLRRRLHGSSARLQRSARVIQRSRS
jgi:hypothetical protein